MRRPTNHHVSSTAVLVYRIRSCVSHHAGPIFHGRHVHSGWNDVGAKTGRRWRHVAESFPKTYTSSFGIGTLLVVEQSSLEDCPGEEVGVMYTFLYGGLQVSPWGCGWLEIPGVSQVEKGNIVIRRPCLLRTLQQYTLLYTAVCRVHDT